MADPEALLRPSDVIGERVRELRRLRGWTAKQLAEKCSDVGATDLTSPAILNIETGRRGPDGKRSRNVTVEELLILATVLSVAPDSLLFPLDGTGQSVTAPIEVTPKRHVSDRALLRRWAAGIEPLSPDDDFWTYFDDAAPTVAAQLDEDRLKVMIDGAVKKELRKHVGDVKEMAGLFLNVAMQQAPPGADNSKALADVVKILAEYDVSTEEIIADSSVFPEEQDRDSEAAPSDRSPDEEHQ